MKTCEEGKLLAGAAVFLSPWGNGVGYRTDFPCAEFLLSCKRDASHCQPVLIFHFAPIRVREKRMNTHKTSKTPRSHQEMGNKVVKKVLQDGTYFRRGRITNQELQTSSKQLQHEK
jgi:hypothetical protein